MTRMTDSSGSTTYCYDNRGNVVSKTETIVGSPGTTTYTYNLADRLMGVSYPVGSVAVSYTRDAEGRIASISSGGGSIVPSISYLPFGPATQYTFAAGGQTLTKTYDANYRATDVVGSTLNLHFALDAVGDIVKEGNNPGVPVGLESYQYDPLYRLQQVNDQTGALWQSYTYNKTGDRLSKTTQGITPVDSYNYTSGIHHLCNISARGSREAPRIPTQTQRWVACAYGCL